MAFPTGWSGRQKITIDATKVSGTSNFTNMPILIKDSNIPDAAYAAMLTTGADIRFSSDLAGTTELAFEIVAIDTTAKTAELWVKIPTLDYDDNTIIYMWYGNASATAYAVTDTYGAQAVWSDYKGVYHLQSLTADSTAGAHTLTNNNTVTSGTGKIGSAASLASASSESLSINDNLNISSGNVTIDAWINPTTTTSDDINRTAIISHWDDTAKVDYRLGLGATGLFAARHAPNTSWNDTSQKAISSVLQKITLVYDGTSIYLYHNGAVHNSAAVSSTGSGTATTATKIGIGASPTGASTYYNGIVDEARFRPSAVTADWIATEYNNQNDPTTFLTMTNEPLAGSSSGSFLLFF